MVGRPVNRSVSQPVSHSVSQ